MQEHISGPRSKRNKRKKNLKMIFTGIAALAFIIAISVVVVVAVQNAPDKNPSLENTDAVHSDSATDNTSSDSGFSSDEPANDGPVEPISSATVSVVGDILTHLSVLDAAHDTKTGAYEFDPFFEYVTPYITKADYAVANLEVTLAGAERKYTGYPRFNAPDSIATSMKAAGFDMALTANNHCFDTGLSGLQRTLRVAANTGMNTLGTVYDKSATKYIVKNINDIRIGMVCYTFETGDKYPDRPSINGILTSVESVGHINSFDYNQLDKFYAEMEQHIKGMKNEGAEALIVYIHWGNEYQLSPVNSQKNIAQKLCDMGIDVIVGGHPHVIQPMDLLTSTTDENHKTVCLYSTGNFLSNQRRNLMDLKTGNTEDGIVFSVTFTKYSDGTVAMEDTNVLPTWINLHKVNGKNVYSILPLDESVSDWKSAFGLTDAEHTHAKESYARTMSLVENGLNKSKTYLKEAMEARRAAFANQNN